ncbi:MAG: hypothetical protein ACKESB_02220 [Candidatus Hodgkinia cicadicola]
MWVWVEVAWWGGGGKENRRVVVAGWRGRGERDFGLMSEGMGIVERWCDRKEKSWNPLAVQFYELAAFRRYHATSSTSQLPAPTSSAGGPAAVGGSVMRWSRSGLVLKMRGEGEKVGFARCTNATRKCCKGFWKHRWGVCKSGL